MSSKQILTLLSGAIICLLIGLIYAWSIFVAPLEAEFGWTRAQTSATFTVSMISFCIAGMVSGAVIKRHAPRLIVLLAAGLLCVGFVAASRINSVLGLYISYGVFCGAGVGLSYNAVISTVSKWFPTKTGVISGVLLMCFGFGGMVLGTLASALIVAMSWRTTFLVFAVLFAAVLAAFSLGIRAPRSGELAERPTAQQRTANAAQTEMTAAQMLRRPSFWLYFLWATVLSAAGLAIIGNSSMIAQEIGASVAAAATITGMLSICSGLGRVAIGIIFDRFGRAVSAACTNVLMILAMAVIVAAAVGSSVPVFVAGGILLGFGYGSIPPQNASFVNQFYGTQNYALNFSIMNLNLIPASILGPLVAGMIQTQTGSYFSMYIILLVACVITAFAQFFIKRP